ncbi:MAG: UvrD-helicase domain-containing protein [Planctomycetales bacterium]|nr:UvrD-helicase domain-containing protein [Planctomycetales bacterium]
MASTLRLDSPHSITLPNLVIKASAGTGKTYHLSNRYLRLILDGVSPDLILATTFTRKAAGEILGRVLLRLAQAATSPDKLAELADAIERPKLARSECVQALRSLVKNLHRVRIATLDAFFVQLATSFSLELGLPPGWQILDETEHPELRDQAIETLLAEEETGEVVKLMHLLSKGDVQRKITDEIRGTVGQLHDLYLESHESSWFQIPKSTPPTIETLNERLEELRSLDLPDHQNVLKTAIQNVETLLADNGDSFEAFCKSGVSGKLLAGEKVFNRKEIPAVVINLLDPFLEYARSRAVNQYAWQTESTFALLQKFDQRFAALAHDRRQFGFADIVRSIAAASQASELDQYVLRLDGAIDHLLLDEFQDTSSSQWAAVRPFAKRTCETSEQDRSFFCVGDGKQAIYGWRGGDADILETMPQQLQSIEQHSLNDSYRSSKPVIDFVNQVNSNLHQHNNLGDLQRTADRWSQQFPQHATQRTKLAGVVTLETATELETKDSDAKRNHIRRYAADRIAEVVRQVPNASVAVLTRTNEGVGKMVYQLRQRQILASEEGGNPLTDSAAVQLVLSRLRLVDHPQDTVAWYHLASSPWAEKLGIRATVDMRRSERFAEETRWQLANDGYGTNLLRWSEQLFPYCNAREWGRLQQLVELAYQYQQRIESPRQIGLAWQQRRSARADAFIAFVERQKMADTSANPVRVMTVHQSKGLQFDVVFLVEMDKDLAGQTPTCVHGKPGSQGKISKVARYVNAAFRPFFPADIQTIHDSAAADKFREELCVFYVAATRAIHALHMITSPDAENKNGKAKRTASGLVRSAYRLFPVEAGRIETLAGNLDWRKNHPELCETSPAAITTHEPAQHRPPLVKPSSGQRILRNASPSGLEGGGKVTLGNRLRLSNAKAMEFGSLVHAWFETIDWLEQYKFDQAILDRIGHQLQASDSVLKSARAQFKKMLQQDSLKRLLSAGRYRDTKWLTKVGLQGKTLDVQVRNEQAIMAKLGTQMVSGFIDRLVVLTENGQPVAAEIIDYKTDGMDGLSRTEQKRLTEHYAPQLRAYRQSLSQMLHLDAQRIQLTLVFVGPGVVQEVP